MGCAFSKSVEPSTIETSAGDKPLRIKIPKDLSRKEAKIIPSNVKERTYGSYFKD